MVILAFWDKRFAEFTTFDETPVRLVLLAPLKGGNVRTKERLWSLSIGHKMHFSDFFCHQYLHMSNFFCTFALGFDSCRTS